MQLTSKLIPMDVAARVVNSPMKVPLLTDKPFEATGTLEKGIHLHWALPDVLTRATSTQKNPPRFRGIPDLWLIVRFNPASGDKRTSRAWVLDAVTGKKQSLADWQPPDTRDEARIHTAPGMIKRVGRGWGEWDLSERFDALTTAYYPACRTRLGFHDDLADLGNITAGKVSYTVIGWYSRISFDPFYNDGFRRRDRVGHRQDIRANKSLATRISKAGISSELNWQPSVRIKENVQPTKAESNVMRALSQISTAEMKSRSSVVDNLVSAIPLGPDNPKHSVVDSLMHNSVKTYTICHGSVMDVPVREASLIGLSTLPADKVFLYPNVQRAMAEVASKTQQEQQVDWLDMMLGNMGQQSGSVAGVIDLPGAQHARTFQSVPGKTSFFARLEIHPQPVAAAPVFQIMDFSDSAVMVSSGNWPEIHARSSMVKFSDMISSIPAPVLNQPPAQPAGPTDQQIIDWISKLRLDFAAARQTSEGNKKPLDHRLIRIQDHRPNAQPTPQGRSADGSGPDTAGWWIDMGEPDVPVDIEKNTEHRVLAELRRSIGGAQIHMPDAANIFEVPGARWYRPWAPHLVVFGAKRSYRHGADGRFRLDSHLTTRVSGESMIGLRVGNATVFAKDFLASVADLSAAGLPAAAGELIQEHALLDAENASMMAKAARVPPSTTGAVKRPTPALMAASSRSVWLKRGDLVKPEQKATLDLVAPIGTPSSAAGLQAWRDWYGPLFLDTKYTHRRKTFNAAWQLPADHVEVTDKSPAVAPDKVSVFAERQIAKVTVAKVLKSTLITEIGIDPYGKPIPKKPSPNGVDGKTFEEMDIVSTSLSKLDEQLFDSGEREVGGFVHVNQVRLFDTFGTPVNWSTNDESLNPLPDWATAVPARLSSWGRLNFRMQSADDKDVEATPLMPPICGILLPDFVDQALEVYDADGSAIGQLTADDPVSSPNVAGILAVKFTLLPWIADALPAGAEPTTAIQNPTLRQLVQSLLMQSASFAANAPGWHETGFTAMMRVFDTVRSTLDPSAKTPDTRVRLLGEPIIVMNMRLAYEASNSTPQKLKSEPELIAEPPALPVLHVRVGDVTRPDDGVLGCFLLGDSPELGRFAPVSLEAASSAVLNQMVFKSGSQKTEKVTHPFIAGQVSEFDVPANTNIDTVVLADARGNLYATCGMLPRKTVILPRDFIDPSVRKLKPTFAVGPILGFDVQGTLHPVLPPPKIEGMESEFVHDDDASYPVTPLPPILAVAELPSKRVRLTEGWVRMFVK